MKKIKIQELRDFHDIKLAFYIDMVQYELIRKSGVYLCPWYGRDEKLWYNNQLTYWSNTEPNKEWEKVEIEFNTEPVINNTYSIF